jgi:hypothetical protein
VEACLIARELLDRGEVRRLAVLCPPQLAEQKKLRGTPIPDSWQNQKASWSRDLQTFTVSAKGRNATYGSPNPNDYARLWNACAPAGSGESTVGTFLTYEYELVATGLNGVADASGFITNTTNASNYLGHFSGIFQNQSTSSPASNGYYVFNIQFNNTSWAATNNFAAPDQFGGKK